MIATTYDERMALIAELAQKYNKRTNMRNAVKASNTRARKAAQTKVKRDFMDIPTESNIYQYTDSSKYAKEYYGETMYETTRFDNDWGDY
jgi:hypothetical protein